jgi:polar amino acid transport system substrate-binding protein
MLGIVATLVVAAALAVPAGAGEVLDRVLANKKLVNALDAEYPPFSFLDTNKEMDGFDVDVAKEVAKRLGVEAQQVTPGWDVITAGKWAGRWDVSIGSMTATKERTAVLDFPVQYYFSEAVLLVNKNNATAQEAKDLSGKKIGVQVSTTYEKYLQKDLEIDAAGAPPVTYRIDNPQIVFYDEEPQGIEDLSLGDGAKLGCDWWRGGFDVEEIGDALARFLNEPREHVEKLYTRWLGQRQSLREKANGDCIFFDKAAGCTIYPVRPRQCRTWPFWESNIKTPEDWEETRQMCPGSGKGDLIPAEEITRRLQVIKL